MKKAMINTLLGVLIYHVGSHLIMDYGLADEMRYPLFGAFTLIFLALYLMNKESELEIIKEYMYEGLWTESRLYAKVVHIANRLSLTEAEAMERVKKYYNIVQGDGNLIEISLK